MELFAIIYNFLSYNSIIILKLIVAVLTFYHHYQFIILFSFLNIFHNMV